MPTFEIRSEEEFPTLKNAPVTEAVLEFRARAQSTWDEQAVTSALKRQLPGYPNFQRVQSCISTIELKPDPPAPSERSEKWSWEGVVLRPAEENSVARFALATFSFSQLPPYRNWDSFIKEALRLWEVHKSLANISEIDRIGLRYINTIRTNQKTFQIEDYLVSSPREPEGLDLPFAHFLHRDTLAVPGYDYTVQIIRTIQPGNPTTDNGAEIVVDIDVSTTKPWEGGQEELGYRLSEMRWLKNKAFFGSLTKSARALLQ